MARRVDYFFRETITGLRRNGLVGFAAMSTVFISLFLLGGALLIGRQVGLVVDATTANVEVAPSWNASWTCSTEMAMTRPET